MKYPLFTPEGIEGMTRLAEQSLEVVNARIDRLERMAMLIDTEEREVIGERLSLALGGEAGPYPEENDVVDDLTEAIWLLLNEARIKGAKA